MGEAISGCTQFSVWQINPAPVPLLQCRSPMPSVRLGQTAWRMVQSPAVVFAIALAIRLRLAAQVLPDKAWPFFYQYNEPSRIAWALVSGYGFSSPWPNSPLLPTAQQPPVYPLLVAAIFKLFGAYSLSSLWTLVVLNATFSALTAVVILQIGKTAFGQLAGVLAAWVWSCWLYEAAVSIRIWESSLSALLLATALLQLPELAGSLRRPRWLVFGLLAGMSVLNNTTLLAVFPLFWLWLWIHYRRRLQSCNRQLLASIAVCVLTFVPWTIRNYATFHRLMPIRDNLGLELWIGNHEGEARLNGDDFLRMVAEYSRLGEIRFMDTDSRSRCNSFGSTQESFCASRCSVSSGSGLCPTARRGPTSACWPGWESFSRSAAEGPKPWLAPSLWWLSRWCTTSPIPTTRIATP